MWQKKRETLLAASRLWQDQIVKKGLSVDSLKGFTGAELEIKKKEREQAVSEIIETIIDSGIVDFPAGVRAQTVISLLCRNNSGVLNHEDFTLSLGRILLADQPKLLFQLLTNQAKETDLLRDLTQKV